MLTVLTNHNGRQPTLPVFTRVDDVERFMASATVPEEATFLPVPPVVAVTSKSFWVQPESSPYPGVCSFLINPDLTRPVTLTGSDEKMPLVCYAVNGRLLIGHVEEGEQRQLLRPVIVGLHHAVDLSNARCLGRAEAAM